MSWVEFYIFAFPFYKGRLNQDLFFTYVAFDFYPSFWVSGR